VTADAVPERLRWAVEVLAIDPADRVLEIGCGRGVAVSLICARLDGGTVTAIDRSATMIDAARQRNAAHVASGRAVLQAVALDAADLPSARFDKILAVNVNLFWLGPATRELSLVTRLLAPGGALYLCYEPPDAARIAEIADKLTGVLAPGFVMTTLTTTRRARSLLCVVARPQLPPMS
jgi:SAM-dependent methyltransferase